ncbi:hypothetical protein Desti_3290 [Desulfomonile tiedjei DSM 6799]|uniref:Uncharacterized protein n=1 Tax=Desulfomonile tiedjei (strain ATCC 49306 / DSM 6799 / DCB-1) TaxID=706587 RepID=I4C8Q7_DESTA|nr:hypothetical protein Desti_3290 [Desulfomonile tiedjei DSM 6799]
MGKRHAAILNSDSSSVKISVKCENDTRIRLAIFRSLSLNFEGLSCRNSAEFTLTSSLC